MDSFAITEGLAAQERQEAQSEPISSKLSEETNKFQRAIAVWRGKITIWHGFEAHMHYATNTP